MISGYDGLGSASLINRRCGEVEILRFQWQFRLSFYGCIANIIEDSKPKSVEDTLRSEK